MDKLNLLQACLSITHAVSGRVLTDEIRCRFPKWEDHSYECFHDVTLRELTGHSIDADLYKLPCIDKPTNILLSTPTYKAVQVLLFEQARTTAMKEIQGTQGNDQLRLGACTSVVKILLRKDAEIMVLQPHIITSAWPNDLTIPLNVDRLKVMVPALRQWYLYSLWDVVNESHIWGVIEQCGDASLFTSEITEEHLPTCLPRGVMGIIRAYLIRSRAAFMTHIYPQHA
jgi:hypothetical protein